MTKDELKLALKHAKRDERHLSNAETRYWCDQYKLLAIQAVEALSQPEPWEKFCDSNCVWTDHHPDCKLAERKPLTDEEKQAMWERTKVYLTPKRSYFQGIADSEVAHGIKVEP